MKSKSIFSFDVLLLVSTLSLIIIGVLFIYSSGITSSGQRVSSEHIKQIVWAIIGIISAFSLAFIDYSRVRNLTSIIYLAILLLLIITLLFGKVVNGARSWIGFFNLGIQPSEFAKLATILFLAQYLSNNKRNIQKLTVFLRAFLIAAIPMMLILAQPDMGTALVFMPIFLFMTFLAGAKTSHIGFILFAGGLSIFLGMMPEWYFRKGYDPNFIVSILTQKRLIFLVMTTFCLIYLISLFGLFRYKLTAFYWFAYSSLAMFFSFFGAMAVDKVLQDYQKLRLIVFLDPYIQERGAGWNIIQSITAVGSGGLYGKGYLQGTQSHYRFLPQQSTDFIFSILSEEWGFVGGLITFILLGIILIRSLMIAKGSKDLFGGFLAVGICGMFFFHGLINIGMAIGVMPITGIPLLFVSYGGSALLSSMISIGLLLSIYGRRYRY